MPASPSSPPSPSVALLSATPPSTAAASPLPSSPSAADASPMVASGTATPASAGTGVGIGENVNGLLGVVLAPPGNENQRPGIPHEAGVNGGLNTICVEVLLSSSISVRPAALAVQGAVKSPASPPSLLLELLLDVLPELLEPPSPLLPEPLRLEALLLEPLLLEPLLLE